MYLEGQFRLLCSAVTITHISLQYKIENINLYFSAEINGGAELQFHHGHKLMSKQSFKSTQSFENTGVFLVND